MESPVSDLFSKDPKVLARMADELIETLKTRLAEFDAKQSAHYERLNAYIADDEARERWERAEELKEQRAEHHRTWMRAREPMVREIMSIARAKADAMPPRPMLIPRVPEAFLAQVRAEADNA